MNQQELIPHLFRTEFRKIVSVLVQHYGIGHMAEAEDIASDTFAKALRIWPFRGIPSNPSGWLYTAARNKARNVIRHQAVFEGSVSKEIVRDAQPVVQTDSDWSEGHISDSQLRMMFVLCHPSIAHEAQIGLSLRILCGFGIDEIANAFLTNRETINKRLFRAREKLRQEGIRMELPSASEMHSRLDNVLSTVYLLFNEGYYSETDDAVLREDMCLEAMRLTQLLIQHPLTNKPAVRALMALMCFHASRFGARRNAGIAMVLYDDQDESQWNEELIHQGMVYFHQSAEGNKLTKYHLEAAIAYWHTKKSDTGDKWNSILELYDHLLKVECSPIAALNRTFALSKVKGREVAIGEAEKLNLLSNHYYFVLLGHLYSGFNNELARENLNRALALVKTNADRQVIQTMAERLV